MPPAKKRKLSNTTPEDGHPESSHTSGKRSQAHIGSLSGDMVGAVRERLSAILDFAREIDYIVKYGRLPKGRLPEGETFQQGKQDTQEEEIPPLTSVEEDLTQQSLHELYGSYKLDNDGKSIMSSLFQMMAKVKDKDRTGGHAESGVADTVEIEGRTDEASSSVEDLFSHQGLLSTAARLLETVDTLAKEREKWGHQNVQIIALSSFTDKNYEQVGIDPVYLSVDKHRVFERFLDCYPGPGMELTDKFEGEFQSLMKSIDNRRRWRYNKFSEISARGVIDDFFECLVSGKVLTASSESNLQVVPEALLLHRPNPKTGAEHLGESMFMPIVHGGTVTFLSGYTDYLSILVKGHCPVGSQEWVRSRKTMVKWNEELLEQAVAPNVALLEAKWPGAVLKSHIPQVVAEALAIHVRTNSMNVPFCLTSSEEWLFGVLNFREVPSATTGQGFRGSFILTDLVRLQTPADALFILMALHYWCSAKGEDVYTLMSKLSAA